MLKIRVHNLLKKGEDFKNFNLLPCISLFWDDNMIAINMGIGRWCLQLNVINFIKIMEEQKQPAPATSKNKQFFQKTFGKLLVLCFGMSWLMVIFKTFGIGFMKNLSWGTVLVPPLFFMLTSLSYIIILFAYVKWFKMPEYGLSEKEIHLIKRRGHLHKKPTKIKSGLVKAIILVISGLIAYLIIH